ncbi:GNAT family N-acetyltransferase [Noviherbaspirillum aridicola]|uniref:N-acetyltransferase domain-containing protein n=1 Tax=Noviherbaspirillum aridicola TaxID=2849687 RepID=A0ABQ4Q3X8_9BURK|nr:GNAT family N-acetyltransferase [Noviherbaspirillum aridicola]GIZ51885.1 hypothetical protein NCCP691_18990 [Noviherbaspirillum aridicola]
MTYDFRPLEPDEVRPLQVMLASCNMPSSDVTSKNFKDFLVARKGSDGKTMLACVGMERYGDSALVKTLAVEPSVRGQGWAKQMLGLVEERARREGIRAAYVVTNEAIDFFTARGYERIVPTDVPEELRNTRVFAVIPPMAVCLKKTISATFVVDYDRPFPHMDGAAPVRQVPRGWRPPKE